MPPYKKLSALCMTILSWQNKSNEAMDLTATAVYIRAYKETFELFSRECRKPASNEFKTTTVC